MVDQINGPENFVDARTFQNQLGELGNTVAHKMDREAVKLMRPAFAAIDIYMMIRQSQAIYNLFFFINADERRKNDPDWKPGYFAAILPLIRCMIDCLYNITLIFENEGVHGNQFRLSGFKRILEELDTQQARYGGAPEWNNFIARRRAEVDFEMRTVGLTEAEARNAKFWLTLSTYLRVSPGTALTPHQQFLQRLTLGNWKEYSAMAHATFNGLSPTAILFTPSDVPYESRPVFEDSVDRAISLHISRVAGVLLCILKEVQAKFHFPDANIDKRLHYVWTQLLPLSDIKELYDERYAQLMKDKNIQPH